MKFFSFIISIVGITLSAMSASYAANYTSKDSSGNNWVRYQNYKVRLNLPKDWQVEHDLYGMPLTVLGPMKNGFRPVLSILHTPIYNLNFNHELLKKTQNQYYNGRKKWANSLEEGKFVSKIPYRHLKWANGNDGFEMGFHYQNNGKNYEERSVQVVCGGRLFFVKTLSTDQSTSEEKATLAKLVNEINCTATTKADGPYEPSPMQDLYRKVADEFQSSPWPKREQIKNASLDAKVAIVSALTEFYKDFEESGNTDSFAFHPIKKPEDKAFAKIKDRMDRFVNAFVGTAFAKEEYNCFFGGWPSKFVTKNGVSTCGYPWDTNEKYEQAKGNCEEGSLACNPALFGSGVCAPVSDSNVRAHATMVCNSKSKKSIDEILKDPSYDQANLEETIESAKSVCSQEPYVSENYGLCSTLKDKLGLAINAAKPVDQAEQDFLNGLEDLKPEDYEVAAKAWADGWSEFEARCIDQNGEISTAENCAHDAEKLLADAEMLENRGNSIERELSSLEEPSDETESTLNNQSCVNCNVPGSEANENLGSETTVTQEIKSDVDENGCTAEERKNSAKGIGDCFKKNFLYQGSNALTSIGGSIAKTAWTGAKCVGNAILGVVKSLWDTVKAVWDGICWVGNKIWSGVKWLVGCSESETATSAKAAAASATDNAAIDKFKKDPVGTSVGLMTKVYEAIEENQKTTTHCEKWDGIPMMPGSTCIKPGNYACMSCETRFQGGCATAGYIVGEVGPAFFTGGGSLGLKATTWGAKITTLAAKASKVTGITKLVTKVKQVKTAAKLLRVESKVQKGTKPLDLLSKVAKRSGKSAALVSGKQGVKATVNLSKLERNLGKLTKVLGTAAQVVRWPLKKAQQIIRSLRNGKSILEALKPIKGSRIARLAKETAKAEKLAQKAASPNVSKSIVTKLSQYRAANFVLKSGSWVAKTTTKVAEIPISMVKTAVSNTVGGVVKTSKGLVGLVTFPVRAPAKIFTSAQKYMAKRGFEYVEKQVAKNLAQQPQKLISNPWVDYLYKTNKVKSIKSAAIAGTTVQSLKYVDQMAIFAQHREEVGGTSDESIHKIAIAQGKTDEQVRDDLKLVKANSIYTDKIQTALYEGREPSANDLHNYSLVSGKYEDVLINDIIKMKTDGATSETIPQFTALEYKAFAKMNEISIEEAKTRIADEVTYSLIDEKISKIYIDAEHPPHFSAQEYSAYARINGISIEEAKVQLLKIVENTVIEAQGGLVPDDKKISSNTPEKIDPLLQNVTGGNE